MDVEKAFLQGQSYAQLAEETGEDLRHVNFRLPIRCIASLRQLQGYDDFNPVMEVLHLIKPGTGLRDAPRAFSRKLKKCTAAFGCTPLRVDDQVECHYRGGCVVMIIAILVDDIKVAGEA